MSGTASLALQVARRDAGLSQEELSARSGVSERTIRSLESGRAKRPHRETLLSLGNALGLTGPSLEHFVAAWRETTRALHELFHGRAPEAALREEFARQRGKIRERTITTWVNVGPDRRWGELEVRRGFDVVEGEVDSFLWMYSAPSDLLVSRLDPIECVNVEPVDSVDGLEVGGGTAKALLGSLNQTLRPGDAYTLGYTVDYRAALPENYHGTPLDNEYLFAVAAPMQLLLIEVRFDPAAVPARAWQVRQDTVDGPRVESVAARISPFGVLCLMLGPVPSGVHGLRWEWDE